MTRCQFRCVFRRFWRSFELSLLRSTVGQQLFTFLCILDWCMRPVSGGGTIICWLQRPRLGARMTSAQHHWGTFASNRKKGKTTQYCAVGKHSPTAYFSLVPASLESHFCNPHPGPPLCCEACWQKKSVLPSDTRRSCLTPPFDEDTLSSQSCCSSHMPSGSQSSQRPLPSCDALCELCGRFALSHTFDSTDVAFRLMSCSVKQISHKCSLLVCEWCCS